MANVVNLIGVVKNGDRIVKYVLRNSMGVVGSFTASELFSNDFIFGNFSAKQVSQSGITISCKYCKLNDLPVYDMSGRLISKPKVTVLYALVSSNGKRIGFCMMGADGIVFQKLYRDSILEIMRNEATNAYVKSSRGSYIVRPKYNAFKERIVQ